MDRRLLFVVLMVTLLALGWGWRSWPDRGAATRTEPPGNAASKKDWPRSVEGEAFRTPSRPPIPAEGEFQAQGEALSGPLPAPDPVPWNSAGPRPDKLFQDPQPKRGAINPSSPQAPERDQDPPAPGGCRPPTPAEREWARKNVIVTRNVRLNRLGFERINAQRASQGLPLLTAAEWDMAPLGQESEGQTAEALAASRGQGLAPQAGVGAVLPAYVDNSTLKYFPPVRDQGALNSCGPWAALYYCYTHMNALARNLDVKNGGAGNNSYIFSPKFAYNLLNNGLDQGSWLVGAWTIAKAHGCATWADWPYDSDYRAWPLAAGVYRNAIAYRADAYGSLTGCETEAGLNQLKTYLTNGYVLCFVTTCVVGRYDPSVAGWLFKAIGNDPSTTADDPFVGKNACYYTTIGDSYTHALTIVGYNDDIWIDLNSNGVVDVGEKGALRICNSRGTSVWDGGFTWLAYDALKAVSAVPGGPAGGAVWSPDRRTMAFNSPAYWVTARAAYTPKVLAEFTLNHARRSELKVTLGISDVGATTPTSTWQPYYSRLNSQGGGAFAFNGTSTAVDATFVFDFTDLLPPAGQAKRWFLGVCDTTAGSPAILKTYKLINVSTGAVLACADLPKTVDAATAYAWLDWTYNPANTPPVLTSGPAATPHPAYVGQALAFSVAASDADGDPVTCAWNFGDGTNGSGATASHAYAAAGTYTATVTASDGKGGSASGSVTVSILSLVVAPAIATQPANITVTAGQTATFTVSASGTAPLAYQWRKNGVNLAGATGASYTTPPTATTDTGALFSVVVSNTAGSASSSNAVLTVTDASGPLLDVGSVLLKGTASDVSGVASLKVNGAAVTVGSDSSWQKEVPLTGATTPITLTATDNAGNTTNRTLVISK